MTVRLMGSSKQNAVHSAEVTAEVAPSLVPRGRVGFRTALLIPPFFLKGISGGEHDSRQGNGKSISQ